jgi:hypothetical protein
MSIASRSSIVLAGMGPAPLKRVLRVSAERPRKALRLKAIDGIMSLIMHVGQR